MGSCLSRWKMLPAVSTARRSTRLAFTGLLHWSTCCSSGHETADSRHTPVPDLLPKVRTDLRRKIMSDRSYWAMAHKSPHIRLTAMYSELCLAKNLRRLCKLVRLRVLLAFPRPSSDLILMTLVRWPRGFSDHCHDN